MYRKVSGGRRVSLEQTMEWDALHRFLEDPDRLLAEFLNS